MIVILNCGKKTYLFAQIDALVYGVSCRVILPALNQIVDCYP